jgi:hypothetical protein
MAETLHEAKGKSGNLQEVNSIRETLAPIPIRVHELNNRKSEGISPESQNEDARNITA